MLTKIKFTIPFRPSFVSIMSANKLHVLALVSQLPHSKSQSKVVKHVVKFRRCESLFSIIFSPINLLFRGPVFLNAYLRFQLQPLSICPSLHAFFIEPTNAPVYVVLKHKQPIQLCGCRKLLRCSIVLYCLCTEIGLFETHNRFFFNFL